MRRPRWDRLAAAALTLTAIGFFIAANGTGRPCEAEAAVKVEPIIFSEYEAPEPEYIGEFTLTGYCLCEKCCGKWSAEANGPGYVQKTASGTIPTAGQTVGTDWDMLPAGTVIYIEGVGERTVEDKTAGWINEKYDGRVIDLLCGSHEEAAAVGKQTVEVWKVIK